MEILFYVILDALISGAMLWLASLLTAVDLNFKDAVITVSISSIVSIIPSFGWLLSIIVFFYLLKKFTFASIWPDLLLMVAISKLVSIFVMVFIMSAL